MEGQLQRICLQQTYDFVMRELGMDPVMEETEDVVEGGRHKRRSRGLSSGTGPPLVEPSARRPAPAVLCET
ncbi:hypothetical protein X943_001358 [Babesia divergens]|uniref:Uncharacterized protein n=1 Tax=Babesia divergens TaxID=32595 RepID=A0AAD9G6V3_BABDI|nr:hypothetical protein X943_001358 [Babesia divergens]